MSIAAARQEREVARPVVRFGDFEFDHAAQELRRRGRPAPLEGRAMTLLTVLLERPGELVTRAEIVERLWGSDAFIDVESGINRARGAALRAHRPGQGLSVRRAHRR